MSEPRPERMMALFAAARELPADERGPFVLREAGGDAPLAAEVLSLLRHDSPTEDLLALHARAAAAELISSDPASTSASIRSIVSATEEPAPERIGRYRVLRALGRGGFGRVYLAEQDEPRRQVALKVAHAQASPTDRRRFHAEGEALARLQHPGIARVFDAGVWRECGDRPYIVMEYIEGLALDDYAAAHALSRRRRMALLAEVCDAVAHAHRRGVIHRDLAPKNILVGEDGAPRILDFGVARLLDSRGGSRTLARDGASLVGTLGYMSPEQLSGDPLLIDTRTDVYALGVIAFELLTGRRFLDVSAMSITAALEAARTAPAARPSSVDRSLRGDLDAITLRATERDPERRYPSAHALAMDLRRWLRDEPVDAHTPSALYRARKFAMRHRASTAAAVVLVVGLSIAAVYAANARQAEREAHAAALNALDAIVTRLISPLAPKLGSLDERAELLEIIGPDVERIAAGSPTSVAAQQIRARYLSALGDIEDSRGSLAQALSLRGEALAIHRRLVGAAPDNAEFAHEASLAIVRVGDLLIQGGSLEQGLALYEEALALDEEQARRHPDDLGILSNLYWSYRRLNDLRREENPERSSLLSVRAREVAQSMQDLAPGAWRSLEANVDLRRRLADAAWLRGDLTESAAEGRAAIDLANRLLALDPMSRHLQGQVMLAYGAAIRALIDAQMFDSAERLVLDSAATLSAYTGATPDSLQRMMTDRALMKFRLDVALERGDAPTSDRLVVESLSLADRLIAALPGDFEMLEWRAALLTLRLYLMDCGGRGAATLVEVGRLLAHAEAVDAMYPDRKEALESTRTWRVTAMTAVDGRWLFSDDASILAHERVTAEIARASSR